MTSLSLLPFVYLIKKSTRPYKVIIVVVCSGLTSISTFFSHITTVSGCDRELNAHSYSAASLKYHAPDTLQDTTPSHIIQTLGRPVLALARKSECQARCSWYHF